MIVRASIGSPPRMRGKAPLDASGKLRLGITPAYAGKRGGSRKKASLNEDHPRVCGEKVMMK